MDTRLKQIKLVQIKKREGYETVMCFHLNYETQLHFAQLIISAHNLQTVDRGYSERLYAMCCFCVFFSSTHGHMVEMWLGILQL